MKTERPKCGTEVLVVSSLFVAAAEDDADAELVANNQHRRLQPAPAKRNRS